MADAVIYDCIVLYEQDREQLNFRVSIMADSTNDMAEQIQIHMEWVVLKCECKILTYKL